MLRIILTKIRSWRMLLFALLILSAPVEGFMQEQKDGSVIQHDLDSLQLLINQCDVDTCKFEILQVFFWQHASYDINRVRNTGEQAYRLILNSKNLQRRSDGYDIKGYLYESERKYDSAAFFFHKALNLARKTGYNSRIRWSYYHLGLIYGAAGNPDSALYYYKTLIRRYPSGISSPPSDFDIYRQMAYIFNDVYQKPDSAERYFKKMLLLSRESADNQREIESDINLMNFYYKTNQVKKLLETINETLVLAEKYSHEKAMINIYNMIGDMFLVNKKNYDLALVYYNKVLEICRPEYKHWEATILNDIGDVYLKMGKDSLALQHVKEGLKVATTLNLKHQISESYRNFGKIYKSQGKLLEAIHHFQVCYNTGCDKCSKVVFHHALIDIADSYMKLGNREQALEYYVKSLQLAREFNAPLEQAISNLRLGNYYSNRNLSSARPFYESAMLFATRSNHLQTIRDIADTLSSYYEKNADYQSALRYESLAREMRDSIAIIENEANLADWQLQFEIEKINKETRLNEQLATAEIKRQKIFRNGSLLITLLFIILGSVVYLGYRRKRKDNVLLEKMAADLHRADEMKLRFFANVSHELRTPLTLILNPAKNLLESDSTNKEQKKQLQYIFNNAIRLHDLTNQIMDLQKLDAGKLVLNPEEDDIIEYCIGIASSFESLCFKKNNSIILRSNCKSVITKFDKDKIGKILSNLLTNAFKFSYGNSDIELKLEIVSEGFKIIVRDQGIGIPAEEIDKAFKQYYQASSNHFSEGSGIGLAYVKELSSFMNGKAEMASIVQKGTTVTITLPLVSCRIMDNSLYELIIPKVKHPIPNEIPFADDMGEDQRLVLIVEDNDELRTFISDLLKQDYQLIFAINGRTGAETAFKHLPDMIISDVMMPDMNGFEMCAMIKKDERTSHIPVILLTAKDDMQSSIEGYQTGADDYIIKPFDNELLRLKIRNMMATSEASRRQFDLKSILTADALKLGNTDKIFMKKCLANIEKHIDDSSFSVEILAGEMMFSNRNFYRKIKALSNQTPADLIRIYRLHYAKKLIQNTDMKVFEIAIAVGYEDVNRFRQAFKKQFGLPPSSVAAPRVSDSTSAL